MVIISNVQKKSKGYLPPGTCEFELWLRAQPLVQEVLDCFRFGIKYKTAGFSQPETV